jgi:transposase-like protein
MPKTKGHRAPRPKSKGRRYTAAQKQRILEVAKQEGLSGEQVKKRFGVSTLSFYRWRGPVRRRRGIATSKAPQAVLNGNQGLLRQQVRAGIQSILPEVIREEVSAAMKALLGRG